VTTEPPPAALDSPAWKHSWSKSTRPELREVDPHRLRRFPSPGDRRNAAARDEPKPMLLFSAVSRFPATSLRLHRGELLPEVPIDLLFQFRASVEP
jgi:hypothetical protein